MLLIDAKAYLERGTKKHWYNLAWYFPQQTEVKFAPKYSYRRVNGKREKYQKVLYTKSYIKPQWKQMRQDLVSFFTLPKNEWALRYAYGVFGFLYFLKTGNALHLFLMGALSVDNKNSGHAAVGATTLTVSLTMAGSANLCVGSGGIRADALTPSVTSCKIGATSFTSIGNLSDAGNNINGNMFYLKSPSTGAQNIDFVFTSSDNTQNYCSSGVISFIGADSTTPLTNFTSSTATGNGPQVTVTSATGNIILDFMVAQVGPNVTSSPGGSQTTQYQDASQGGYNTVGERCLISGSTAPGQASLAVGWTLSSSNPYVELGVNIVAGATTTRTHLLSLLGVGA